MNQIIKNVHNVLLVLFSEMIQPQLGYEHVKTKNPLIVEAFQH